MRDVIVDLGERSDDPIENCITNSFDEHEQILDAKNKVVTMGYLGEKQKSCLYPKETHCCL